MPLEVSEEIVVFFTFFQAFIFSIHLENRLLASDRSVMINMYELKWALMFRLVHVAAEEVGGRGQLSVAVVQQTVSGWVSTCTGRLLDQVVFLSLARPHGGEVGVRRTSLLASLMDPAWLDASSQSPAHMHPHSDTPACFYNWEKGLRRQLKPRVLLWVKLIFSILLHTYSVRWVHPLGDFYSVPSHFSSKRACQMSWSFPVFVLKWWLEMLIPRQIVL